MQNLLLTCCLLLLVVFPIYLWAKPKSVDLMLANVANLTEIFNHGEQYWVSEKYDGVRAYWNGSQMLTRRGNVIHCPEWFVAGLPPMPLDGELWLARGEFERTSAIIRKKNHIDGEWRDIKFMVFDLPQSSLPFEIRQGQLRQLLQTVDPWIRQVKQLQVANKMEVQTIFKQIVNAGGEGVMLNIENGFYTHGRTDNLLKLKPYLDAEATVLEHFKGKGKYADLMGAILVRNKSGKVFKIGSGFSDKERARPPEVGSMVTYRYSGYTNKGVPRFATFLRQREE